MFSSRFRMAVLSAFLFSGLTAGPAAAAKPVAPPAPPGRPPAVSEPPLTPDQFAASDHKVAVALAYLAGVGADAPELASLACVSPPSVPQTTESVSGSATIQSCTVPQGFLAGIEARDQILGHYCGPAVGQVIANYSWAMGPGANVFTQQQLAGWMGTDANGGTSSEALASGLEVATRGAPRRPAAWTWAVTPLRDNDGDGHVGDELHGFIRANVTGSRMPLAFSLKPHDRFAKYRLSSWPNPVDSPGHWIAGYGWVGNYSNVNESARTYYTDSSRDEGGSTGKFWDPTKHIAEMIRVHTGVFVW